MLGLKVKQETCDSLKYNSLESYSLTKNDETVTFSSTENYPIFMRQCKYFGADGKTIERFYKIYQPLNPDKAFRFFYKGEKPKLYINGLLELKAGYKKHNDQREKDMRNSGQLGEDDAYTFEKLPEVFICSGERDALCCAALGY